MIEEADRDGEIHLLIKFYVHPLINLCRKVPSKGENNTQGFRVLKDPDVLAQSSDIIGGNSSILNWPITPPPPPPPKK